MKARDIKHLASIARFAAGGTRPLAGPLKVAWETNYICNSRCRSCQRWEEKKDETILSTQEGKALIDDIRRLGVLSLSFTGGEPLLRRDIFELMAHAKGRGLGTSLSSNGLLITKERAREIVATGVDIVYVSIDGATPASNDYIRGIPGYFDRAWAALDQLRSARISGRPQLFINVTVSRKNLHELMTLGALATEHGLDGMTLQPAQRFKDVMLDCDPDLLLDERDAGALSEEVEALIARYGEMIPIMDHYFAEFATYAAEPEALYKYRCTAAYLFLEINPYGEVFPCPVEFASLGNVRERPLTEIWWSRRADELRERIKAGDHPICWFNCIQPLNLLVSYLHPARIGRLADRKLWRHVLYKSGV